MRSATRVRGHGHWPMVLRLFFVDIDDNDRPLRCLARMYHLEKIEDADAKFLNRNRIGDTQCGKRNQQYEGKAAGQSETARQA